MEVLLSLPKQSVKSQKISWQVPYNDGIPIPIPARTSNRSRTSNRPSFIVSPFNIVEPPINSFNPDYQETPRISNRSSFMVTSPSNIVESRIDSFNTNYQKTLQRLEEIEDMDCECDEDEYGATRSTHYARESSRTILKEIARSMKSDFPLGFASLDSTGGIDLVWKNHQTKNEINVFIPSSLNKNKSLYIRNFDNGKSRLFINPSIKLLVKALDSLYK